MYRDNPEKEAHQSIVNLAGKKTKFSSDEADVIVRTYYRELGYHSDSRSDGLLSPDETTKVSFKARNVIIFGGGRGRWVKRRSVSKIKAAENLVAKARDALGIQIGGKKATEVVKERTSKKLVKQAEKKREAKLEMLASQAAMLELTFQMTPEERLESLVNPSFEKLVLSTMEKHKRILESYDNLSKIGKQLDRDLSVSTPPLFIDGEDYTKEHIWEEDGVQIRLKLSTGVGIEIHIGGGLAPVDPFRMRMMFSGFGGEDQIGYISGGLKFTNFGIQPLLLLITSNIKRSGAGTKMLRLFCKLIKSYGFNNFAAQGVGEEGAAFLNELERRGKIGIHYRSEGHWLISCGDILDDPHQTKFWL